MIFIHILFFKPHPLWVASQARRSQIASRCPVVHWMWGPGGVIPAVTQTFNDRERSVAVAPGQEGVPRPPGFPLPGARPARQPRRPRPGRSARPRRHPPEPSRQPRNDTARAGRLDPRGPQTHHGRRAANAPTAGSHKAPATPVVLVTPAGRPAPSLRWARETAIG